MKIFIGFANERPDVSKVCKNSIESWNIDLDINYISSELIPGWTRKRLPDQSTNHSFARFLVPYLSNYEGYSIFMDDDFIVKCDLTETMKYINYNDSISVVQHDYVPILNKKMIGEGYNNVQIKYPRKNWASFILFNNSHIDCKKLTLDYVNTASAKELIELEWASSIGKLPLEYNFLVEEYDPIDNIKCYHYTLGGPWIKEKENCQYSEVWKKYDSN